MSMLVSSARFGTPSGGGGGPWPPTISPALPNPAAAFTMIGQGFGAQSGNAAGVSFPATNTVRCGNTPSDVWSPDSASSPPINRSEIAQSTTIPNGLLTHISVDVFWESGSANDAEYLTFMQGRDTSETNDAPFSLMMQSGSDSMKVNLYYAGAYRDIYVDPDPLVRDRWYHFDVDLLVSGPSSMTGKCKVVRDGVTLVNLAGLAIGATFMDDHWYYKNGVLRAAAVGSLATDQWMKFRNLSIT